MSQELYKKVYVACVEFAVYNKKNILENAEKFWPLLNEFINEFLKENIYGINEEDYQLLQQLLINILNDMVQAMDNRDSVLMADTVEYGLREFLELFFDEEEVMLLKREAGLSE